MRQSRARVLVAAGVALVGAVVFVTAGLVNYGRLERLLDVRLGETLVTLARMAAVSVDMPVENDAIGYALTLDYLSRVRHEGGAAAVVLLDASGEVLIADPPFMHERTYLSLDNDPLAKALTGEAAYGERYRVGSVDFKSAYAPVLGPLGDVVGVVGVEAPANFFGALSDVRVTQIIAMATGLLLVIGMTAVMWHYWRRSELSERALSDSQKLAMIGQMTATMAHEVRNPLSIIRATAERIRKRHGDGSELFDFIPEEVDRLDRLTKWYLDFARPVHGQMTKTNLATVVADSLARIRKELQSSGVSVESPAETANVFIRADGDRLLQALLNLFMNAVQAMPEGGTLRIDITTEKKTVVLTVSDTGRGIPQKDIARVFEPFHTTRADGSGLGLAVVRQVVEEHDGRIAVESEERRGTDFRLTFPRLQVHEENPVV